MRILLAALSQIFELLLQGKNFRENSIQFSRQKKKSALSLRTYIYTHTYVLHTHTHVNVTRARRGEGRASTFIYIRGIYHGGKEEENCSFRTPGVLTRNGKEEDDSRDDDDDDDGG